jgi:hypothetical protein
MCARFAEGTTARAALRMALSQLGDPEVGASHRWRLGFLPACRNPAPRDLALASLAAGPAHSLSRSQPVFLPICHPSKAGSDFGNVVAVKIGGTSVTHSL